MAITKHKTSQLFKKATRQKPITPVITPGGKDQTALEAEQTDYLNFGTPEQLAQDDEEWDTMISKTTPEQLATLKRMFDEELRREGSVPLDFTVK